MARRLTTRRLGLSLAAAAVLVGVLVPWTGASAAPKATGITLVRLLESAPRYRMDVLAPQLAAAGAAAARSNAATRATEQALVVSWTPWLLAHDRCATAATRCAAGRFDVHPRAGGIAASPRLVDALLDMEVTCPGCRTTKKWSSVATLLPSGAPVNVFDLLFGRDPEALRSVAEAIRLEVASWPGVNRCVSDVWGNLAGNKAWQHLPVWLRAMRRHRAVALERTGLLVGFDPGDYFGRACGLSTFLVPYQYFQGLLDPEGQLLVDSFVYESFNPPLRYALPVRVCSSSYAVDQGRWRRHIPRTLEELVPRSLESRAAVYTDTRQSLQVVAPAGWRCDAAFAGDGGSWMAVYPPNEAPPGSADVFEQGHRSEREGVTLTAIPACYSCLLSLVCPYFASARQQWDGTYGGIHPDPCTRPRKERVVRLTGATVRIVDPPGVVGHGWPSGGADAALSEAGFGVRRGQGSYLETCTLPAGESSRCDSLLGWYAAASGWTLWG